MMLVKPAGPSACLPPSAASACSPAGGGGSGAGGGGGGDEGPLEQWEVHERPKRTRGKRHAQHGAHIRGRHERDHAAQPGGGLPNAREEFEAHVRRWARQPESGGGGP